MANNINIEEVIEVVTKLGMQNGIKSTILLVRQIKIQNPQATIDDVLNILIDTYSELYKESVI